MRGAGLIVTLSILLAGGCAWLHPAAEEPGARPPAADGLRPASAPFPPIVVGYEESGGNRTATGGTAVAAPPARPVPRIEVDAQARTVRIPVRVSGGKAGVVEWLLSSGSKHAGMSVLVTDCPPRDVAEALAKIGLKPGAHPEVRGEDRVRDARGEQVEITLLLPAPPAQAGSTAGAKVAGEFRLAAHRLLAVKLSGRPLEAGAWVYVGPKTIREGDAEVCLTDLSGSLFTTNLHDTSALAYLTAVAAEAGGDAGEAPAAFYLSSQVPAQISGPLFLEVRPAPAPKRAAAAPAVGADPP
jgi:hypothetical protein